MKATAIRGRTQTRVRRDREVAVATLLGHADAGRADQYSENDQSDQIDNRPAPIEGAGEIAFRVEVERHLEPPLDRPLNGTKLPYPKLTCQKSTQRGCD
jgi:hypothetical protein